jgi:hypothetical protein
MLKRVHSVTLPVALLAALTAPSSGVSAKTGKSNSAKATSEQTDSAVIWREPSDIAARNLLWGPGGEADQPHGPFKFVEEDLNGTSPKYVVRDRDDVKWTVKLGMEARPETVASRLVWSVGYFTNEDYFLEHVQIDGIPPHLKRGQKLIGPDGSMQAARLKRHLGDEKDLANWQWRNDPFTGTRQLNGLKVMMALINNWDLKDDNNKLYADKRSSERKYIVSDLGASFGATGLTFPFNHSKGDLNAYAHSRFISRVSGDYVDFRTPSRPSLIYIARLPEFFSRIPLDSLVHHIPREDARWIGHYLSSLSSAQIRDAFRAAGYTQEQIDGFSKVVEERITALNDL